MFFLSVDSFPCAPFLCAVTAIFYSHVSSLMCAKCVTISLSLSSCLFSRCPIILFHSVHPTFLAVTSLDLVIAQSPLPSSSLRHPSWVKTSREGALKARLSWRNNHNLQILTSLMDHGRGKGESGIVRDGPRSIVAAAAHVATHTQILGKL